MNNAFKISYQIIISLNIANYGILPINQNTKIAFQY